MFVASSHWSTWSKPSLWQSNINCSIRYTRECIRIFSNGSCFGLSSIEEPCKNLYYASTRYMHGNVIAEDTLNNNTIEILNKMRKKTTLNRLIIEVVKLIFNNQYVQVKLLETYLSTGSSFLNASFTSQVGAPLPLYAVASPVEIGILQIAIQKDNSSFLFKFSQRSHIQGKRYIKNYS